MQPLPKAAWDKDDEDDDDATLARKGARTANDVARARLEKLMKNPEKPVRKSLPSVLHLNDIFSFYSSKVSIPEKKTKTKDPNKAPEFVYNVMGQYA